MAEFDINKVQGNDRFIAGGAVLVLIASLLPFYAISFTAGSGDLNLGGGSKSYNAWGDGSFGWNKVAILLALVAGAVVIARLAGALDNVTLPAGINLITLALSGLATLIFLLRFVTAFKSESFFGARATAHPTFGWYLALLVSAAMTYFAFLNFKASGEELPSKPSSTPPPPVAP